jgi:hypothetical protein
LHATLLCLLKPLLLPTLATAAMPQWSRPLHLLQTPLREQQPTNKKDTHTAQAQHQPAGGHCCGGRHHRLQQLAEPGWLSTVLCCSAPHTSCVQPCSDLASGVGGTGAPLCQQSLPAETASACKHRHRAATHQLLSAPLPGRMLLFSCRTELKLCCCAAHRVQDLPCW